MNRPRTAVVTIAQGRHEHLRGQGWGLARQSRPPDLYVAVAMGDPGVPHVVAESHPQAVTPVVGVVEGSLPLAAARNVGAQAAIQAGAEHLVFLDVDCIPEVDTVARYADVLTSAAGEGAEPVVVCGEVHYLPPVARPADYRSPGLGGLAEPHPARPTVGRSALLPGDVRLFWSLSFAVSARDWEVIGGFSEDYVGYGAEDTDFGQRLAAAGGTMLWAGGAAAYHQHHFTETPPRHHLLSIVRNANLFHEKWGWFPMEGWLDEFAGLGLAHLDRRSGRWLVNTSATVPSP